MHAVLDVAIGLAKPFGDAVDTKELMQCIRGRLSQRSAMYAQLDWDECLEKLMDGLSDPSCPRDKARGWHVLYWLVFLDFQLSTV